MTDPALQAALYLEAVLPALPALAAHDEALAAALAGPDVAVSLFAPSKLRARVAVTSNRASVTHEPQRADLRLWFPSTGQLIHAFDGSGRPAFALPFAGLIHLPRARRLVIAGKRLETLLNTRAPGHLALHAWGNLLVGIHAATTLLRRRPSAWHGLPARGSIAFACPAFPTPLWIDLSTLTVGTSEPSAPVAARVTFADLSTVFAELDHALDAPAALGLGTLRVEGHLPLAEALGQLMLQAGRLLKPSSQLSAHSS